MTSNNTLWRQYMAQVNQIGRGYNPADEKDRNEIARIWREEIKKAKPGEGVMLSGTPEEWDFWLRLLRSGRE